MGFGTFYGRLTVAKYCPWRRQLTLDFHDVNDVKGLGVAVVELPVLTFVTLIEGDAVDIELPFGVILEITDEDWGKLREFWMENRGKTVSDLYEPIVRRW